MVLRKVDVHKHELAAGVGLVSLGIGAALSFAPDRTAALVGWGGRVHLARVIGAADLVVGLGLLLGRRRRSEWMVARALLNAVMAFIYAWVLAKGTPERGRVIGGLGLMSGLTATDYLLSLRLRDTGISYKR
jgi:urea transporter